MAYTNAATMNARFRRDMRAFLKRAEDNADSVLRETALALLASIVKRSPVDTGRFRGNWFVQEAISPVVSLNEDKRGSGVISAGQMELARFKVGDKLYILNHLPYSIVLENGEYGTGPYATNKTTRDGYSVQAPHGMVKITVREFEQYVRAAAAKVKK